MLTYPKKIHQLTTIVKDRKRLSVLIAVVVVLVLTAIIFSAEFVLKNHQAIKKPAVALSPDIVPGETRDCKPRGIAYYRTDKTLSVDPTNDQILYVNVEEKGLYKSTDGGQTWHQIDNGIKTYGLSSNPSKPCYGEYYITAIDPTNHNRLLLGSNDIVGNLSDRYAQTGGLYETLDAGKSWHQLINKTMDEYVTSLAIDPNHTSTIYYGTNSQAVSNNGGPTKSYVTKGVFYKTTDDGKSWTELPTGLETNTGGQFIAVDPGNSRHLFGATLSFGYPNGSNSGRQTIGPQLGPVESFDGGQTWNREATRLPVGYQAINDTDIAPTNFNHVFLTPFVSEGYAGKSFYSIDGGRTYQQSNMVMDTFTYDPSDPAGNRMVGYSWEGSNQKTMWFSSDAGATWQASGTLPADIANLSDTDTRVSKIVWDVQHPNELFMSGAGGLVWRSNDLGQSWTRLLSYSNL
ncbi:MAG TPA: hypothetical protein VGS28_02970 [Candidatus Saccharimonadales bacterium]|nr:hypothetical protein [Candidatus Saccharimonadales bacterium]